MDDHHLESADVLEMKYKKGKEELEAKLKKAKSLQEKISQLKSGKDFLMQNDIIMLGFEMSTKTTRINNSSFAESELRMLREKIAEIESSGVVVSANEKDQLTHEVEAMQKSVTDATRVQEEIIKAKKELGFCSDAEIEKLQKDLDSVENVFRKLQCFNAGIINYYGWHHRIIII